MGGGGVYRIQVAGCLSEDWSDWLGGQVMASERENTTTITANLPDQAALHGLLARVRDLGLILLSVERRMDRNWSA
jgi:hypothetical protein